MICLCHGGACNGYLDQAQASPVSVLMQPAIEKADGVGERLSRLMQNTTCSQNWTRNEKRNGLPTVLPFSIGNPRSRRYS